VNSDGSLRQNDNNIKYASVTIGNYSDTITKHKLMGILTVVTILKIWINKMKCSIRHLTEGL
jgi:hypothetical protein